VAGVRLIAMGHKALTDGFALLGFETFPNADADTVESVLSELLLSKEKAIVFLEERLTHAEQAESSSKQIHTESSLLRARREAARVIITEIPPLNAPETYRPLVEDLVNRVLGSKVLDFKE